MAKARYILGFSVLGVAVIAAVTAAAYSSGGLPDPRNVGEATPNPSPTATADPVTFGVIGDSITAWIGQEAGSWTTYVGNDGVVFSEEGWAQNGAPIELMEANTPEIDADVLVILAGTNNLVSALTTEQKLDLFDRIVDKSGVQEVVISAVPPYDPNPALSTAWNQELRGYAAAEDYEFVDAWSSSRTAAGTYVAGDTVDGIHATPEAARAAAASIRLAVLAAD